MIRLICRRFAAWRTSVWLRRATAALSKHDWWRSRAGDQ